MPVLVYRSPIKPTLSQWRNPRWRPKGQGHETSKQALSSAPLVRVFDRYFNEVTIFSLVIICDHSVHFLVFNAARLISFVTVLDHVHSIFLFVS